MNSCAFFKQSLTESSDSNDILVPSEYVKMGLVICYHHNEYDDANVELMILTMTPDTSCEERT